VLISMFVLLFGLMGVAAIFPLGNHYAGRGEQYDRGTALGDAALAELRARGMLRPQHWYYAPNTNGGVNVTTTTGDPRFVDANLNFNAPLPQNNNDPGPGHAFVLDPLGAAAGRTAGQTDLDLFPLFDFSQGDPQGVSNNGVPTAWKPSPGIGVLGNRWPIRRLTLAQAGGLPLSTAVASAIFDLRDDLAVELPKQSDRPGVQRWKTNNNNTPDDPRDDVIIARDYAGSYTWLATVVPTDAAGLAALQPSHPLYGNALCDVSVAVFYKRDVTPSFESERSLGATLHAGNELELFSSGSNAYDAIDAATEELRAGHWIALAGVHPTTGQFLLKWYRLLSIDDETDDSGAYPLRRATLDGPEWPWDVKSNPNDPDRATNLRAIIVPGVIAVSTQAVPMEAVE
jgi:hypothetical protein